MLLAIAAILVSLFGWVGWHSEGPTFQHFHDGVQWTIISVSLYCGVGWCVVTGFRAVENFRNRKWTRPAAFGSFLLAALLSPALALAVLGLITVTVDACVRWRTFQGESGLVFLVAPVYASIVSVFGVVVMSLYLIVGKPAEQRPCSGRAE